MKIVYDVSMTIEPKMQVYKNREHLRPEFITTAEHDKQGIHQTRVCLDLHTGTHLDAPLHVVPDGGTIDDYPLAEMLVSCQVFDLTHVHEKIIAADIEDLPIASGKFVLFKTKNSKRKDLGEDFIYVDLTAARTLVSKRIVGVGIDALGIERDQAGHMTHRILFQAGIKILEGLCLGHVPPGSYTLLMAPLKIQGVEAALVRALLLG